MDNPSLPPAGWYPAPDDVSTQRYWNGVSWTEHRAPAAPSGPASPDEVATDRLARRRRFAAKHRHRGAGVVLVVLGGLETLGALIGMFSSSPASLLLPLAVGVALVVWSIYLLRGRGPKPEAVPATGVALPEGRAHLDKGSTRAEQAKQSDAAFEADLERRLGQVRERAAAHDLLGEQRHLRTLLAWAKGTRGARGVKQATQEIAGLRAQGFVSSHSRVGVIRPEGYVAAASRTGRWLAASDRVGQKEIEVFQEFVAQDTSVALIDANTQAMVYVDGQEQVVKRLSVSGAVVGAVLPGNALLWSGLMAKNEKHDSRLAEFQVGSTSWTMRCVISPSEANRARSIAMRINSIADSLVDG